MASLKEHARNLALKNPARFNEFEVALVKAGLYQYFRRGPGMQDEYNISKMRAGLMPIIKEYFPFQDWHFTTNTLPELQEYSASKDLQP